MPFSLTGSLPDDGANLAPGSDEKGSLASLSSESGEVRIERVSKHTSSLNLWKKRLEHVPEYVWEHTELETLVLAENGLKEISEQICLLRNLRTLDLGHNVLTAVPDTLSEIDGLSDFLYLHDNRLNSLPASFGKFKKLRYLNISANKFEEIPECVSYMSGLIELRMSDNRLTSLPNSIDNLKRLRELHLRNNRLASIPDSIGNLQELRQLDLRSNPLTYLPETMAKLPRLEKLDLRWIDTLIVPGWIKQLEGRGCVVYF